MRFNPVYSDNLNELFDKVFTQYVEDFENVADFSGKIPRCIAEDLGDKGFLEEEIEFMVMAVVFSEPTDDNHNTRYFLKDYEKYNPTFSPTPKHFCVNCSVLIRDKFTAYGLDLLEPYDNLDELKRGVKENYEVDLSEEESQYFFKVYKNFFIEKEPDFFIDEEELGQDLDDVERE